MFSLIVPVYRNEESIPDLIERLEDLNRRMAGDLEAILVVDGSPDRSLDLLSTSLQYAEFASQLVVLSRNFGSFSAIIAGLAYARADLAAIMSADLQEPPELILEFRAKLESGQFDVVVGTRARRADPLTDRLLSSTFWRLYRSFVQKEIPRGGVDVFACNRPFREQLLRLTEHNTTLVGLIYWLGFRRGEVSYSRQPRRYGRSAWSVARKVRYLLDSTFAFSDLPVRILSVIGVAGIALSIVLGLLILVARWSGQITVPGYSATAILIMFFGGLNSLGLGLIGEYIWRTFENTKSRPAYVVAQCREFKAEKKAEWKETSKTMPVR